jgi:DNA-directed RNA polymerase subunit RPC12/RpoP
MAGDALVMVNVDYIPFDTSDMYEFRCLACRCIFAIDGFGGKKPVACPACGKKFASSKDYERQVEE